MIEAGTLGTNSGLILKGVSATFHFRACRAVFRRYQALFCGNTWAICHQTFPLSEVSPASSPLYPIICNPLFLASIGDPKFKDIDRVLASLASDFVVQSHWATHTQIPHLAHLGFWRLMQISNFLRSLSEERDCQRPLTAFEDEYTQTEPTRHVVSWMYALLHSNHTAMSMPFWTKWEHDLGMTFSKAERAKTAQHIFKAARSVRYQESGYQLLSSLYRAPASLSKMYPGQPNCYWRCGGKEGCLVHLLWSCPLITPFWDQIKLHLPKFTDRMIPEDSAFFLLHHYKFPSGSYKNSVFLHQLNAARSCISGNWRKTIPPSLSVWAPRVNKIMPMEKLVASELGNSTKFEEYWFYWKEFTSSADSLSLLEDPGSL